MPTNPTRNRVNPQTMTQHLYAGLTGYGSRRLPEKPTSGWTN